MSRVVTKNRSNNECFDFQGTKEVPSTLCKLDKNIVECEEFKNYVINAIIFFSFQRNLNQSPFNSWIHNFQDYLLGDDI